MLPHLPPPLPTCLRSTPDIAIVGNVTVDLVDGRRSLGGASSYAAAVAAAWGTRACVLTAHNPAEAALGRAFEVSAGQWLGGCQRLWCGVLHPPVQPGCWQRAPAHAWPAAEAIVVLPAPPLTGP